MTANLVRAPAEEDTAPETLASVTTGLVEAPECNRFNANLASQHTVDNVANSYVMNVVFSHAVSLTSSVRLQAMRVFYQLQVSPAPGGRDLQRRADWPPVLPVRAGAGGLRGHERV